jgi:hypothetical protein
MISKYILKVVRNKSMNKIIQIDIQNLNFSLLVPNLNKMKNSNSSLKGSYFLKFDKE